MSTSEPAPPLDAVANAPKTEGGWEVVDHPHGLAILFDFPGRPTLLGVPLTPDEADRLATALATKAALTRLADRQSDSPAPESSP